jgi:hypothetical protein
VALDGDFRDRPLVEVAREPWRPDHLRRIIDPGNYPRSHPVIRELFRGMFDQRLGVNPSRVNVTPFYGEIGANQNWSGWAAPKTAGFVGLFVYGGGSGGGAGLTGASGTARGGGGGGASGGASRLVVPAMFLPRELFVQCGNGGLGGASSGNAGAAATSTTVAALPNATASNIILVSGAAAATGGAAGTAAGGNAGGTGETIELQANGFAHGYGDWTALAGQNGSLGGALGTAGQNVVWGAGGLFCSGGTGGGSLNTSNTGGAGGNIAPLGGGGGGVLAPILPAGGAIGANGNPGIRIDHPFCSCGGTGAGTNNANATAHPGGSGAWCSGGGGGGGALTGGAGGNGGPGVAFLCWW